MGMTAKFRIGLIGLGLVATCQLEALRLLDAVEIVSVCDARPDVVAAWAQNCSARAYGDYADLLRDGGIDLVMVMTPVSTHRQIVEAAAQAGVHVFCEKPLAVTLADGEAMIAACQQAGVKLFYGSCYRYLPAIRKAFELIRQGAIGRLQMMSEQLLGGQGLAGYSQLGSIHYPLGGPGGAGMGLVDHGIHLIDIFSWFGGAAPERVLGTGQISGAPPQSEFLAMFFPGGAVGHLLYNAATYSTALPNEGMFSGGQGWLTDGSITSAGAWENEPGSISVYGTEGSLRIFHYTNALFLNTGTGPRRVELDGRPAFGHFATQFEDCMRSVRTGTPPSVGGEVGLQALRVLLSVYSDTARTVATG
jgi:UDP-N-acetyl-2-amino-2-deoxyglucuronate dehydrogenase